MSLRKRLSSVFISLVVALVALELFSFVLAKFNLLLVNQTPNAYLGHSGSSGLKWRTENSEWGAWHKQNYTDSHKAGCINVTYESNEVGARDSSFLSIRNDHRKYLLLGDSFAEGYGVNRQDSAEYLLERALGVEVLNFGSGAGLGPVQYEIIFNQLASRYPHDGVIVFFLPSNDFSDNDYDYWHGQGWTAFDRNKARYRPYYRKVAESEYEVFIPSDAVKRDDLASYASASAGARANETRSAQFQQFLLDYFWTTNVLRTARIVYLRHSQNAGAPSDVTSKGSDALKPFAGYFDASIEQQKAAVFFINRLISSIKQKEILLVLIPTQWDFERIQQGNNPSSQLWYREFQELARRHNVKVLDLATQPVPHIRDLYLGCDGHWSPAGHLWASRHIAKALARR